MAKVSKLSYHVFYEVLLDKFYNEFKDKGVPKLEKTAPKLWEWKQGPDYIVTLLFKSLEARSLFKMSDPNPGSLLNTPLIEALTYLEYKITKDIDHRYKMPPKEKAEIMFGLFEKD